ncbi:MAG: leucine--tRNA ligase [Verrucomicrobia bacterium]|nr:MAG: leucine--tRNA ligase [Verrucomicrobiota bacterium]
MRRQYPFQIFEPKWQEHWHNGETFRAWNPGESVPADHPFHERHPDTNPGDVPKYYILDMFPYPSGAGLHVGHPEGYTATDILARYKRMGGFNVLHPMGWDAFGLPAEQYAIMTGQHPRITTETNVANFKRQIQSLGFSYDWSREINTTDPGYFRWTQWIFLQLYNSWFNPATNKAEPIDTLAYPPGATTDEQRRAWRDDHRLAYVSEAPVNWCPELGTVLANEEVKDGVSEVGGFPVVRRPMRQWMLRITEYAQRLLDDLDNIDWSDSLKEMQRNWIGRSEGAEVLFSVEDSDVEIAVFTTRPDTLFGATYMVVSPESELLGQIVSAEHKADVEAYQAEAAKKSDLERTDLAKDKSGVFTGAHAINPANGRQVPIWTADYVLAGYGTGAIMAVPAHDSRDLEFAQKFKLPINVVVEAPEGEESLGFTGNGTAVNSDFLDGLPTPEAKRTITAWLEEKALGQGMINYKLRDWLFSRQRYWGEPFPIVWDEGGHVGLSENDLPLTPPNLTDFKPTGTGDPPLACAEEWCQAGEGITRETNTMPQWAGSCWYYLRYIDAQNSDCFVADEAERYWMGSASDDATPGVDLYVGGTEHAVLHLLYARFWHKVLFDLGQVSTPEPFYKLVNQGLILGEDGQKMSKSRGNVVNPDDILAEFGSDAFRLFEMFMGPLEMVKPWNTKGVEGVYRFLGRVWRMFIDEQSEQEFEQQLTVNPERGPELLSALKLNTAVGQAEATAEQLKVLHTCIKKVTEDMEHLRFNTAISAMMVFTNEASNWDIRPLSVMNDFLLLLAPFAPHIAEELYAKGNDGDSTLAYQPWPSFDEAHLVESTIEMAVQVNGKLRDRIQIPADIDKADIERIALESENVQRHTDGKSVKKVIVIPGKLVNIVAV